MFPVDTFQAQYLEERAAADTAKRRAKVEEEQHRAQMAAVSAKLSAHQQQQQQQTATKSHPKSLTQMFAQRPGMTRSHTAPAVPTVFGNIYQGLAVRSTAHSTLRSTTASGASTPRPIPTPTQAPTQAQMDAAMMAERKRDADIVSREARKLNGHRY